MLGRLGGVGARPEMIGLVSDADGAITAVATALKLADMRSKGDVLPGDVVIGTHICPNAPTIPHKPVPFMGSPVTFADIAEEEVTPDMDAILSVDTTKGNRIAKWRGFAITPTAKEGWVLKVSDDLLTIMEIVTGRTARVCPITTQDITPYGNGIDHINSIMQPCTTTDKPVVGVAITTESTVPGCATGASHPEDIEETTRFCVEVAKAYGGGTVQASTTRTSGTSSRRSTVPSSSYKRRGTNPELAYLLTPDSNSLDDDDVVQEDTRGVRWLRAVKACYRLRS